MAKRSLSRTVLPTALTYLGLAIGLVFAVFPILWMFFASLKSNTEIFALPPQLLPKHFTIVAYLSIFNDPTKVRFFLNSYLVAGAVTILTVLIAILAAYAFSRFSFRLKNTLNVFIISTQTVPPITLLIPYFGMVVAFGIFDTYFALILTYLVFTLPYAILLMTGYLNTLPRELDEAVLVDGGTSWSALWRVIVPLSVPGIVATVGLHLSAGVERIPVRADADQIDGHADRADRHRAAHGPARVRMEPDDGDERARIASASASLPVRATLLPRGHDRRLGQGLAMFAPAFTSGLARDAVPASGANLPCLLRAPRGDVAAAPAALALPLVATVLIFQGCLSEELTRSAVKQ